MLASKVGWAGKRHKVMTIIILTVVKSRRGFEPKVHHHQPPGQTLDLVNVELKAEPVQAEVRSQSSRLGAEPG